MPCVSTLRYSDPRIDGYLRYMYDIDGIQVASFRESVLYPAIVLYRICEAQAHASELLLALSLGDFLAFLASEDFHFRAMSALQSWLDLLFDPTNPPPSYFEREIREGMGRREWDEELSKEFPSLFSQPEFTIWSTLVPLPSPTNPSFSRDPDVGHQQLVCNGEMTTLSDEETAQLICLARRLGPTDPIHNNPAKRSGTCLTQAHPDFPTTTINDLLPDLHHSSHHFGCSKVIHRTVLPTCNAFTYIVAYADMTTKGIEQVGGRYHRKYVEENVVWFAKVHKYTWNDYVRLISMFADGRQAPHSQRSIFNDTMSSLQGNFEALRRVAGLSLPSLPDFKLFPRPGFGPPIPTQDLRY